MCPPKTSESYEKEKEVPKGLEDLVRRVPKPKKTGEIPPGLNVPYPHQKCEPVNQGTRPDSILCLSIGRGVLRADSGDRWQWRQQ